MFGLARRNEPSTLTRSQATPLNRWDPWTEFDRIRSEMDNLFSGLFGQTPRISGGMGTFTPAVDLYETKDEVVFNVYLPGMSREDIHLEVIGDTIHLWGDSKPNLPEQNKDVTVHLAQGGFGQFDLRYRLPVEVNPDQCNAIYKSGVLEVHLPKAESARPRSVEVKIEG